MWGIAASLNDILITQFKSVFTLSDFASAFVQSAFYGGYFIIAIPASRVIRSTSYKVGITVSYTHLLATYRKLRLVEDPKFTTRIELHSELVLLEWLLHGVHENNDEIIGDARELISQLADTLDATGLLPALTRPSGCFWEGVLAQSRQ